MPAGNRTGPLGYGPMTGRGAGFCANYGVPGYANPVFGRGLGRGRGFGFRGGPGRGSGFGRSRVGPYDGGYPPPAAPLSSQDELNVLQREAEYLKTELETINQRIAGLQAGEKE